MIKIRNFEKMLDIAENILEYVYEINNYKSSLNSQINSCEINLIDLDHILELNKIDAIELSKLVLTRRDILRERRMLKDELELIERIPDNIWSSLYGVTNKIKTEYTNCKNRDRKYTFRGSLHKCDIKMSDNLLKIVNNKVM